jgi:hypothetical protein
METRKPEAPLLPPPAGLTVPDTLQLTVVRPEILLVHEPATFVIQVTNASATSAKGVTVRVQFNDAWEFSDSEDHSIERRIGEIPPGATREVSLSLVPLRAGQCQVDFQLNSRTHPSSSESVLLDVPPRIIELTLAGPRRRSIGRRAEFVATLVNTSDQDLPETRAEITYDPGCLVVREASVGWESKDAGRIGWPLGTLLRSERVQIQLEFECLAETLQTPLRCSFESDGQRERIHEARLEIVPAQPLDVWIVDGKDPGAVGDAAHFTVHLRNHTTSPLADIDLRISTSPHFDGLELTGNPIPGGGSIVKDAYGIGVHGLSVPAGGDIAIAASARASLPGDGTLRVLVRAPGLPAPFEVEESFVVNPALSAESSVVF